MGVLTDTVVRNFLGDNRANYLTGKSIEVESTGFAYFLVWVNGVCRFSYKSTGAMSREELMEFIDQEMSLK